MSGHEHGPHCDRIELTDGRVMCLSEEPGLRAQIMELMPEAGDHVHVRYVADNPDGTRRFAVMVTRKKGGGCADYPTA